MFGKLVDLCDKFKRTTDYDYSVVFILIHNELRQLSYDGDWGGKEPEKLFAQCLVYFNKFNDYNHLKGLIGEMNVMFPKEKPIPPNLKYYRNLLIELYRTWSKMKGKTEEVIQQHVNQFK